MNDWMKNETLQMGLRKALTLLAGYLVGKGFLDAKDISSASIEALAGGILIGVSWLWSSYVKRAKNAHIAVLKTEVVSARVEAAAAKEETQILVNQISPVKIVPLDQQ